MNINSMVSMGFMKRSVGASVRKDVTGTKQPSGFEQRLTEFRKENAFNRLKSADPPKQKEKEPYDWEKVTCSEQLFSTWDSSLSAEDALAKLDENLSRIGEYKLDGTLDPREALEHIAAQYSIYKRHISQVGDGEQLKELDKLINKHTTEYAKGLSEQLGGFYEEYGMTGERERIYNLAISSVEGMTKAFDKYAVENPKSFAELMNGSEENNLSLANELRKATHKELYIEFQFGRENAGLVNLSKVSMLARHSTSLHNRVAGVTDEEELGVILGNDVVRALDFLDTLHGKRDNEWSAHETAFMKSLTTYVNKHLDKVDKLLEEQTEEYRKSNPMSKQTPYNAIDRESVYSVINYMAKKYKESYSVTDALDAGLSYGSQQYLEKAAVDHPSARYTGSAHWEGVIKKMMSPANWGTRHYTLMQNLLQSGTSSWLNAIA